MNGSALAGTRRFDLIASETKRIIDAYGNSAILSSERSGPVAFSTLSGVDHHVVLLVFGRFLLDIAKMVGGGWPRHSLTLSDRFEYYDLEVDHFVGS